CGFCTTRRTATIPSTTAPMTSPGTMNRPSAGRASLTSAPEHDEPGGEDEETRQARVGEPRRAKVGSRAGRNEHPADHHGEQQADHDADQPRREERAQNAYRRRHESHELLGPTAT